MSAIFEGKQVSCIQSPHRNDEQYNRIIGALQEIFGSQKGESIFKAGFLEELQIFHEFLD